MNDISCCDGRPFITYVLHFDTKYIFFCLHVCVVKKSVYKISGLFAKLIQFFRHVPSKHQTKQKQTQNVKQTKKLDGGK